MSTGETKNIPERKLFIGHAVRVDPNIDKEDTRPVEKRKNPNLSINWTP